MSKFVRSISMLRELASAAMLGLAALAASAAETNSPSAATTNGSPPSASTSQTTLEYLLQALRHEYARPAAIEALVKAGPAAVEPLTNALRDVSPFVRAAAAETLGQIKDKRAIDPLIRALSRDSYNYARAHAAWALGAMNDPKVVAPLIDALSDQHQDVRAAAEIGLVTLGPLAVEPLVKVLNRRGTMALRNSVVRALGSIDDPRVIEPLLGALDDPAVRNTAAVALGDIQEPRAVEPLMKILKAKDHSGGAYAAAALAKIGSPSIEPLTKALTDEDQAIRRLAVIALGEIRDPKVIAALTERLKDASPEVLQAAQEAIEKIQKANQNEPNK